MPGHGKSKRNFEALLGELEAIVTSMESGKMPLDDALDQFQRGTELLRECQKTLDTAEARIKVLENGMLRDLDANAPPPESDDD